MARCKQTARRPSTPLPTVNLPIIDHTVAIPWIPPPSVHPVHPSHCIVDVVAIFPYLGQSKSSNQSDTAIILSSDNETVSGFKCANSKCDFIVTDNNLCQACNEQQIKDTLARARRQQSSILRSQYNTLHHGSVKQSSKRSDRAQTPVKLQYREVAKMTKLQKMRAKARRCTFE